MQSNIDKVELRVNEVNMTVFIQSYTMHYDMYGGAGTFTCDLVMGEDYVGEVHLLNSLINLAKQEAFFQWKINGHAWMNGYLDKIETNYDKGSLTHTISGRDLTAILMDNQVIQAENHPPTSSTLKQYGDAGSLHDLLELLWFNNTEISSITNMNNGFQNAKITLDPPLSIRKYLNNTPFIASQSALQELTGMPHFKAVSFSLGETLYDVATNLCNQRGLILYNPPGTNYILIHTAGFNAQEDPNGLQGHQLVGYDPWGNTDPSGEVAFYNVLKNQGQNNIISCSSKQDITNYYKYIRLCGETLGEDQDFKENAYNGVRYFSERIERIDSIPDLNSDGTPMEGTITPAYMKKMYNGMTKFKSISADSVDAYTWSKTRNLLMNNDLFTQNRELYNIKYTVSNHSPNGGLPYFFGQYAKVYDDFLDLDGITFLIYGVTYTGSKASGLKTEVELASPLSDNGLSYWSRPFAVYEGK
jgi:hypothetical protein